MPMAFKNLVLQTQLRLSQQGGANVQIYAEDRVAMFLEHKFDMLFDAHWWDDYTTWSTTTLATGGVPADDMTAIGLTRFVDLKHVYWTTRAHPLPDLPDDRNPQALFVQGVDPRFITPNATANKVFQVLPYGTEGDGLTLRHRAMPANRPFLPDDIVLMDSQAMILGAAFEYLSDDGANPEAANRTLALYEERYDRITSNENTARLLLDQGSYGNTSDWQVIS